MADETGGVFDGLKSFISEFGSTLAETFKANFNTALIVDTIQEVDLGAKEVAKSFGLGAESVLEIKTAMADAVKEVAIYGKTFTDIANLQQRIGESVGRNIIMSTDNYAKLFKTVEATTLALTPISLALSITDCISVLTLYKEIPASFKSLTSLLASWPVTWEVENNFE